jgi:hypothetical protein
MSGAAWPPLALDDWIETREALYMWTQVIGKVKLELCPFINQCWVRSQPHPLQWQARTSARRRRSRPALR